MKLNGPLKLFLTLNFILFSTFLYLWLGSQAFVWILFLLFLIFFWITFISAPYILQKLKTKQLEGHDPWQANSITQSLCRRLQMAPPRVFISHHQSPFSLCLNHLTSSPALILSHGLLKKLNQEELESLIGYELIKLKQGTSWSQQTCFFFILIFHLLSTALKKSFSLLTGIYSKRGISTDRPLLLFRPLTNIFASLSLIPKDQLQLDKMNTQFISPQTYAEALWKLTSLSSNRPFKGPHHLSYLFSHGVIPNKLRPLSVFQSNSQRIKLFLGRFPL